MGKTRYTDAVNAINDRISHHAGMAKEHRAGIEDLTEKIGVRSRALATHETAVRSLEKARKILIDAERIENDKDNNDDSLVL